MRYHALACDYDGTIAEHGVVPPQCIAALERLRNSGRKIILITGRHLNDLMQVFPHTALFDRIVAENGALLYTPASHEEKLLAEPPPQELLDALAGRGVAFETAKIIISSSDQYQHEVLQAIHDLGLEFHLIFNKGALMVLPSGVNKATGLAAALDTLQMSAHNVVGIGDAENDHAFLALCECSVAVANALPLVKKRADLVTEEEHGYGTAELIGRILNNDLQDVEHVLTRHRLLLGTRQDGTEVFISPYGKAILIAGTSGSGKSTFAAGLLEELNGQAYQYCIIDPEGDYDNFENAVALGNSKTPPVLDEIIRLLEKSQENLSINLLGISVADRPKFFQSLVPHLQGVSIRTGHPHWILVDEAHHLLPPTLDPSPFLAEGILHSVVLITVHPGHVSRAVLSAVDVLIVIGDAPEEMLRDYRIALGQPYSMTETWELRQGEAVVWFRSDHEAPFCIKTVTPTTAKRRHQRKYADGALGPERSFYFRGPEEKLNLKAQNLMLFIQLAEGVDDETWLHHLHKGDYSRWMRLAIKDETLASYIERVEHMRISPNESRALVRAAIEERYTAPA